MHKSSVTITRAYSRSNHPYLIIEKDGLSFASSSKYNPIEEAAKYAQNIDTNDLIILFGFGSGYIPQELNKKTKNLIIFEPLKEIFDYISSENNLFKDLNLKHVYPFNKSLIGELILKNYLPHFDEKVQILIHPNYERFAKAEVDLFLQIARETINQAIGDYQTQAKFASVWLNNMVKNIGLIPHEQFNFTPWKGQKKAWILGAGPKLDVIGKIQSNDLVFASDTAMSYCEAHGVNITAMGSIDPQIHSIYHTHFLKSTIPFVLAQLSSYIPRKNKINNFLFLSNNHPVLRFLITDDLHYLKSNFTNIGSFLTFFAIRMGIEVIELSGIDFSYTKKKPYIQPSYLDILFQNNAIKVNPLSMQFEKLWLDHGIFEGEKIHTPQLDIYRLEFISILESFGYEIAHTKENTLKIINTKIQEPLSSISISSLIKNVKRLYEITNSTQNPKNPEILPILLPLLAKKQIERLNMGQKPVDSLEEDLGFALSYMRSFSTKLYEVMR